MALSTKTRHATLALLLALAPLVLLTRTQEQLFLLALSVSGVLAAAFIVLRDGDEAGSWSIPKGKLASLAGIQITTLFMLKTSSSMPMVSYWFAWIIGLLPIGYLLGRQILVKDNVFIRIWDWLSVIAVFAAGWGCVQYLAGFSDRASGPFEDFNCYGALLYLFLIPAIGASFDPAISATKYRIYLFGIGIGFFALFATYSRGAIGVTLVLSLPLIASFRHAGIKIFKPASVVVAVALACYLAVKFWAHTPISRTLSLATDPSTQFRLMMWKSAWQAWLDHPALGTGLGTYQLQYLHYRLPSETNTTGSLAHNDYLQLLMEGGPLTLAFLLAWGLLSLWLLVRLWRAAGTVENSSSDRLNAAKSISLLLAVLGLFMHAAVNFIFYVGSLSLIAGLYLARAHSIAGAPAARSIRLPIRNSIIISIFAGLSIFSVGGLLVDWAGGQAFNSSTPNTFLSIVKQPPEARYRIAGLVAMLRPNHVSAHETMSVAATDIALAHRGSPLGEKWARRALDESKHWIEVSKGNPLPYQVAGQLLWNFPGLRSHMAPLADRPDGLLLTAIDRHPAQPDSYLILARFWVSQQKPERALRVLRSALPWAGIPITTDSGAKSWLALIAEGRRLSAQMANNPEASQELRSIATEFNRFDFRRTQ